MMKISVYQKWVLFSITTSIVLHQTHAEIESTKHPFDLNKSLNSDFQLKNRHQFQSQEETGPDIGFHTILAGVLCFAAASVSSAGGLGGGGMFVPILNLVAGLDMKTATPVSSFMVTGGSLANFIYSLSMKSSKPLIDYDIALLSEPCMLLGVSLGVICNVIFPEWLITVLLAIFLACSTFTTCSAGFAHWRAETVLVKYQKVGKKEEENGSASLVGSANLEGGCANLEGGLVKEGVSDVGEGLDSLETPLLERKTEVGCVFPMKKLGVLLVIWVSFFALHVLRGDQGKQSLIQIEPCGIGYWLISALQIPLALVFTGWILLQKECSEDHSANPQLITDRKRGQPKLIFPLMALLSGILGGVFGVGGGMLINPVLLQVGIPPQITAATSSFMVLFSSSMSSVQYFMLGMKRLGYALAFTAICFVSSLLGLVLIQRAVAKYGRASLIVFSVGTVMALSAVLITSFGAVDVWRDYKSGKYMGFKLPC